MSQVAVSKASASQVNVPNYIIHLLVAAFAALIASVAGAFAIGLVGELYSLPEEFVVMPESASAAMMARYKTTLREMLSMNYAVHFAMLGGLLGLAFGLTLSSKRRILTAIASIVGGATFAALGGWVLGRCAVYCLQAGNGSSVFLLGYQIDPMVQTTALQCFIWSCIGIGIGAGLVLVQKGPSFLAAGVKGGLLGGLLAGFACSMVIAVAYSESNAYVFVPVDQTERIVWAAICGFGVFLGLASCVHCRVQPTPKVE
jgi:hypothetical protein